MEFRRGSHERRDNRRICPRCQSLCGTKAKCPQCGKKTAARIQINWYIGGKRYRELTACSDRETASAVLQRKEADYWRRQKIGVEREVGGTLREAVDDFVTGLAELSTEYRKQINTVLNALGNGLGWDHPVHAITRSEIEQFKADGLTVLAPTTVRSYMLVLRRFFSHLHQEGWIRRNPTTGVKLPKAVGRKDYLRPDEIGPVLNAFWQLAPDMAPIATTFILGGWRRAEIVNLRREHVDLDKGWAYVLDFEGDELTSAWSPKSESSARAVPLHPVVRSALARVEPVVCPDGRQSPWMFPIVDHRKRVRRKDRLGRPQPVRGDRRSPSTTFFGEKLRQVLKAAKIERRVTLHGLRRTFAVLLQEAGAPDSIIRQALGHSQRGVTELNYLPRRDELVKQWVEKISVRSLRLDNPPSESTIPRHSLVKRISRPLRQPPRLRLVD